MRKLINNSKRKELGVQKKEQHRRNKRRKRKNILKQ